MHSHWYSCHAASILNSRKNVGHGHTNILKSIATAYIFCHYVRILFTSTSLPFAATTIRRFICTPSHVTPAKLSI